MASRKEQKEALRREREAREQAARASAQRKRMVGYGVGGALAVAAVAIVAVLLLSGGDGGGNGGDPELYPGDVSIPDPGPLSTDLDAAAEAAGCKLESKPAAGDDHITDPNERQAYEQNPPTSGRHFQIPEEDGIKDRQPDSEDLVHTLEHGRVVIWFKRNLPDDARGALKTLFDEDQYHLVLTPNETDMPFAVAASAWNASPGQSGTGRLLGCPRYSEQVIDALRAFIGEHRDNGPETVP